MSPNLIYLLSREEIGWHECLHRMLKHNKLPNTPNHTFLLSPSFPPFNPDKLKKNKNKKDEYNHNITGWFLS